MKEKTLLMVLFILCIEPFIPTCVLAKSQVSAEKGAEPVIEKVNINRASAKELAKKLKGIGLNKAKCIVDYREKYGNFVAIDQLKEVKGIGQSILDANKALIAL